MAVSNAWSTGTEWTVGEDLGSDHLPITTTIRCEVPAASASQRGARWNTMTVDWNSFSAAVEEAIELFSTASHSAIASIASTLSFSQRQSSMWESLWQVDTPSPGPPRSFKRQSKNETLCVERSQTTGLNTWRPEP